MYDAKLTSKIPLDTPAVFYEEEFRYMIEQYMPIMRRSQGTTSFKLTSREKTVFNGNFYGLLLERNVPPYLHWVIMRLNDIDSTYAFEGELDEILIPNAEYLDRLREYYQTVHRI